MGLIAIGILVCLLIIPFLNPVLPAWFCRNLSWHLAPLKQDFDGASFNGTCPRCGKHVLQDSQGNWF